MNNKKLFKGALVLFASILMAVSCSSNSKPGDDDTTQKPGDTTTQKQVVAADVSAESKALSTTTLIIATGSGRNDSTAVNLGLKGEDGLKATTTASGTGYKVSVVSFEAIPNANLTSANNEALSGKTAADLATLEAGDFELSGTAGEIKINLNQTRVKTITASLNEETKFGAAKVKIKVEDVSSEKTAVEYEIYLLIKGNS